MKLEHVVLRMISWVGILLVPACAPPLYAPAPWVSEPGFVFNVAPRVVAAPVPEYPDIANGLEVDAEYRVKIRVGADGKLVSAELVNTVLTPDALPEVEEALAEAALAAVWRWEFRPAYQDETPVESVVVVRVVVSPASPQRPN